jgi:hypothetical protein
MLEKIKLKHIILYTFLLTNQISFASTTQNKKAQTMNGVSLKSFGDFSKKWKVVTIRFREDSEEMRVTYANPVAYKTLIKRQNDSSLPYPLGSVFAKIGIKTNRDPLFYSSIAPSGAKRVQFMVKNNNKSKDASVWTFALFNDQGNTFPGDEKENTDACISCHNIAEPRAFVFSELADFSTFGHAKKNDLTKNEKSIDLATNFYEVLPISLPKPFQKLKLKSPKFMKYIGPLVNSNFQGTSDEMIPLLIEQARKTKLPTFYASNSQIYLTMIDINEGNESCQKDSNLSITIYKSIVVPEDISSNKSQIEITSEEKCLKL